MDYKKSTAPGTTVTRDMMSLAEKTGNVYETVRIIGKRSNEIAAEIKHDLERKLQEFSSFTDSLDEVFENREQIEISRYFERLPKPTLIASQEFIDGEIYYRNPSKEKDNIEEL
ncbi:MAG: DNA-directed RNA polymerase subunit omega [Dysgonamonadaceae bacterium]|jgi:DNA-directed RNA polymerase subunit K/omega|nr:DNA-directed RNA polymerase subunit omega [Dysgonamonadaceae bacterium]